MKTIYDILIVLFALLLLVMFIKNTGIVVDKSYQELFNMIFIISLFIVPNMIFWSSPQCFGLKETSLYVAFMTYLMYEYDIFKTIDENYSTSIHDNSPPVIIGGFLLYIAALLVENK